MKSCNISLLLSPLFLFSLFILGLNDWVLKATFHNFLTGKLSDFAGVFALAIFLLAWLPTEKQHYQQGVLWAIALFFSWWKSPFSTDFIAWWSLHFFPIHRVVDITDLSALIVLPFSAYYSTNYKAIYLPKISHYLVSSVACMLFMATSSHKEKYYGLDIPRIYILQKDSLTNSNIDSVFYAYIITDFDLDSVQYPLDIYEENEIVQELERKYIQPLAVKQRKIPNHYQFDSNINARINQTDNEGKKQGIWRFLDYSSWYQITYKDDILNGSYKKFNEAGYLLIEGQFINNQIDGMWTFYEDIGRIKKKHLYKNGEIIKIFENGIEKEVMTRQTIKTRAGLKFVINLLIFVTSCFFLRKGFLAIKPLEKANPFTKLLLLFFLLIIMPMMLIITLIFISMTKIEILPIHSNYHLPESIFFENVIISMALPIIFVILQIIGWSLLLDKRVNFGLLFWWFLAYLFFIITLFQFGFWLAL